MSRFTEQKLYIDGAYVAATSGETFQTINPVNGEVLAEVHAAGQEDVNRALAAARKGQKVWAAMTAMDCAFEDCCATAWEDGSNLASDYLKRRGWKSARSTAPISRRYATQ